MMSGDVPDKSQLRRVIKLHEEAISFIPVNHAKFGQMSRLLASLKEWLEKYDQFQVNPYTTHTSVPKFNSDVELGLGNYTNDDMISPEDN